MPHARSVRSPERNAFPCESRKTPVRSSSGLSHGFIDLFFESNARYYLVDWKSNWLGNMRQSKGKSETEVKCTEIFEFVRVGIHTVIETNRADRQLVTQTGTDRVAHIGQPDVLRAWQ